jgi:hypothetical protein
MSRIVDPRMELGDCGLDDGGRPRRRSTPWPEQALFGHPDGGNLFLAFILTYPEHTWD